MDFLQLTVNYKLYEQWNKCKAEIIRELNELVWVFELMNNSIWNFALLFG